MQDDVSIEGTSGVGLLFFFFLSYNEQTKGNSFNCYESDVANENSKAAGKMKKAKATNEVKEEEIQIEAKLPIGISLTNVAGIDIPTEETGNVLQFLEFCSAFGEVFCK